MILYSVTQCGFVDDFQHFGDIHCLSYAEVERVSLSETFISSKKITALFPRKKRIVCTLDNAFLKKMSCLSD